MWYASDRRMCDAKACQFSLSPIFCTVTPFEARISQSSFFFQHITAVELEDAHLTLQALFASSGLYMYIPSSSQSYGLIENTRASSQRTDIQQSVISMLSMLCNHSRIGASLAAALIQMSIRPTPQTSSQRCRLGRVEEDSGSCSKV